MGWFIALAVIVGLAVLPLGVSAVYDADGPLVRVIAGPVRLRLYPQKKKSRKTKKSKEEAPSDQPAPEPENRPATSAANVPELPPLPEEKKKFSLGDLEKFLPLVRVALDFLGDFRRKLRVNRLEMKLVLAGDDPCDLATNYGRAWVALGNLWPRLEAIFVIKKRDVQIQCDFTADKPRIFARLDLTITLGRLLVLAVRYGIRALIEFFKLKKTM